MAARGRGRGVAQNLLRASAAGAAGRARFRLLESVRDFAAEHGLPPSNLYQWIRALKDAQSVRSGGNPVSVRRKPANANFAEVSVVGRAAGRGLTMTIALSGGHTVTFEGGTVDAAWLQSVLKVVRAC